MLALFSFIWKVWREAYSTQAWGLNISPSSSIFIPSQSIRRPHQLFIPKSLWTHFFHWTELQGILNWRRWRWISTDGYGIISPLMENELMGKENDYYANGWIFISHIPLIHFPLKGRLFDIHLWIFTFIPSILATFRSTFHRNFHASKWALWAPVYSCLFGGKDWENLNNYHSNKP